MHLEEESQWEVKSLFLKWASGDEMRRGLFKREHSQAQVWGGGRLLPSRTASSHVTLKPPRDSHWRQRHQAVTSQSRRCHVYYICSLLYTCPCCLWTTEVCPWTYSMSPASGPAIEGDKHLVTLFFPYYPWHLINAILSFVYASYWACSIQVVHIDTVAESKATATFPQPGQTPQHEVQRQHFSRKSRWQGCPVCCLTGTGQLVLSKMKIQMGYMPIILVLRRMKQEVCELKSSLGYTENSRSASAT
jgi:hypothetical protein